MCLKRVTHVDWSYYVLKYTLKAEPFGELIIDDEVQRQLRLRNLDPSVIKVVNAMTQSQPLSQAEICMQLLKIPMVQVSVLWGDRRVSNPVAYIDSTLPDLRKVEMHSSHGSITTKLDYYENRPDVPFVEAMTYPEYHRTCEFRQSEMTSEKKRQLFVGMDRKGRCVYQREYPIIVRLTNYMPATNPEGFFYTLLLANTPFRLETRLKCENTDTYLGKCQTLGFIDSQQEFESGNCSKLHKVLEDYFSRRFITKYCVESTVNEILKYYLNQEHEKIGRDLVNAFDTTEFEPSHTNIPPLPPYNVSQQHVFDQLKKHDFKGLSVIKGGPGTGKSLLIQGIVKFCTEILKRQVLVLASTGIAASRLPGGRTVHGALKMGTGTKRSISYTSFSAGTKEYARCKAASVMIIDEAFMLTADVLNTAISKFASTENVHSAENIFDRKGIILVGDENQLPPICQHKTKNKHLCQKCLTKSCCYYQFAKEYMLTITERQREDLEFCNFLTGIMQKPPSSEEIERVLGQCLLLPRDVDHKTPEYVQKCNDLWVDFLLHETALSFHPHRRTVSYFNQRILKEKYDSQDIIQITMLTNYEELLTRDSRAAGEKENWFFDSNFHELQEVAIGCAVMSTKNQSYKGTQLSNGARATVQAVHYKAKPITSPVGQTVQDMYVHRIDVLTEPGGQPIPVYRTSEISIHKGHKCVRKSFPLILAYAMTVHKSQGASINCPALLDFRDLFDIGMGYVMLTRKTSRQGLALTALPTPDQLQILQHLPAITENTVNNL